MNAESFRPAAGFKGLWIPICILIDPDLPLACKVILAEVYQLQKEDGCFASNAHFCALIGTKERNLRNHLSALVQAGLLLVQNPTSVRRRLFVAPEIRQAIAAESKVPVTSTFPTVPSKVAQSAPTETSKMSDSSDIIAPSPAANANAPGSFCEDPAGTCHVTRHCTATENTMRVQKEDSIKNTKNRSGGLIHFNFNADTHLLSSEGCILSSLESWERWKGAYEAVLDVPANESEHIARLQHMVSQGFDGDSLLNACVDTGTFPFWHEPPREVVPLHVRPEYGYPW